jgi:probable F420-dependent oxidoreductase
MKFGIAFANVGPYVQPDMAAAYGRIAEEHGIESLWTVEHVVVPAGYASEYPYSSSGRMPGPEESPIPDPLIWLTWVGAATTTLRLATGILILPQRNPPILAKELATLDVLSGGRVELGVGVGWLREEFDALGVPFEERGARTDEYIEALRCLWRDEEPCYEGRYTSFDRAKCYPKPVQDLIPIHVGGHTAAAARRAGRLGDGFFPAGRTSEDELRPLLDTMRASAKEAGRDPDSIEVTAGGVMDADGIRRFADLGVDRIALPPLGFDLDTLREQLGRFSEQVIEKVG